MADEPQTQPAVTQGNEPAARTETGEIKDQQTTQPPGTANKDTTKSAETKPATETKPAEGDKKSDAKGAPDKYEFKAPAGRELDAKAIEAVTPVFKELGLTQDQAQKLIDFQAARDSAANDANMKLVETTRTEWRDKVIKDPALGNGTDNLRPEVKANISRAIDAVGDAKAQEAFKEALDLTGAGDNPTIIAAMNTLGKLLSEGTAVRGGGPANTGQTAPGTAAKPSPAQALYPKLPTSAQA